MEHPSYALNLLLTTEADEGLKLARYLDKLNQQRRTIEQKIFREACSQVEQKRLNERSPYVLVITGQDWHRGVLGILASKLVQKYRKSVFLLNLEGEIAFGSARTVEGANLIPLLNDARPHAIACGGHADAAGMKVEQKDLALFEQALYESAERHWKKIPETPLWLDASLSLEQIDDHFMHELAGLKPFGKGNEEPVFYTRGKLNGSGPRIVGNNHLRLSLQHARGQFSCIGFSMGNKIETLQGSEVELAFRCRYNQYQGRREINLNFLDIRSLDSTLYLQETCGVQNSHTRPDRKMESIRPTRSRLGLIYKLMQNAADENNQLPREFAYMLGHQKQISREEFENAITIFSEIALLKFDDSKITLLSVEGSKDLNDSSTFKKLGGIKNA